MRDRIVKHSGLRLVTVLILAVVLGCSSEPDPVGNDDQPVVDAGEDTTSSPVTDTSPAIDGGDATENTGGATDAQDATADTDSAADVDIEDSGPDGDADPPPGEPMEVLVMFLGANFEFPTPVDIELNGEVYEYWGREQDDPIWDSEVQNARGQILEIDGPLTEIRFDPDQLTVDGLNNHGFGAFGYRVQQRHPDTDLSALSSDEESINFWAHAYDGNQVHWLRNGYDDTFAPNPTFYEFDVPLEWTQTGKMAILVAGHGEHHPYFGEDEHPVADDEEPEPDECDQNLTDCGGECVNLDDNPNYCGDCDISCGNNQVCVNGTCEDDTAEVVTEVLVFFWPSTNWGGPEGVHPVDVRLNDTWYSFHGRTSDDPNWTVELNDGRGEVIYLSEPLDVLELANEQLIVDGLNLFGYGFSHYKILRSDSATDFYNIHDDPDGGINYWAHSTAGRLIGYAGWNQIIEPNPEFYLFDVPASYNDSGKIALYVAGYGVDNPNFPNDCHPEDADDPCLDMD